MTVRYHNTSNCVACLSVEGSWALKEFVEKLRSPNTQVMFLTAFLCSMQVLDGILTSIGLSRFGVTAEGNPLLRSAMQQFGHMEVLAAAKLLSLALIISIAFAALRYRWVRHAFSAVSAVYLFAAILPWSYLLLSH